MSDKVEILRAGVVQYEPRPAGLLVVVEKNRFLRKGNFETSVTDPGKLIVSYRPARALLNWTALSSYLESFRTWSGPAEDAVSLIAADLKSTLAPGYIQVELILSGGGGYRYSVSTVHGDSR